MNSLLSCLCSPCRWLFDSTSVDVEEEETVPLMPESRSSTPSIKTELITLLDNSSADLAQWEVEEERPQLLLCLQTYNHQMLALVLCTGQKIS